jgi:DNA-binding transcriptional MocR family regulator
VTYPGIIDAIRQRGRSQLVTLPVDQDGLRVDAAARLMRATTPAVAYLTTFQNPTGHSTSRTDREMLLAAAETTKTPIVEDRVLADLPLNGQAPPTPLAALRPHAAVITIGSISKVLWGGLRIGWIHTNRTLAAHLRTRRRALDLGSPAPMQFAAAWLLEHRYDDTRTWRIRQLQDSLAALTNAIRPLVWTGSTSNPPGAQTSGSDSHTPPPTPSPTAQRATVSLSRPAARSPSLPARPAT